MTARRRPMECGRSPAQHLAPHNKQGLSKLETLSPGVATPRLRMHWLRQQKIRQQPCCLPSRAVVDGARSADGTDGFATGSAGPSGPGAFGVAAGRSTDGSQATSARGSALGSPLAFAFAFVSPLAFAFVSASGSSLTSSSAATMVSLKRSDEDRVRNSDWSWSARSEATHCALSSAFAALSLISASANKSENVSSAPSQTSTPSRSMQPSISAPGSSEA
mmetsp:Transcript_4490/g.14211  ORF Transcript_4490/g.14211 Transcript_4490/m.14211 type:complete len:220 (-) Transcript_4490:410-1069(-)